MGLCIWMKEVINLSTATTLADASLFRESGISDVAPMAGHVTRKLKWENDILQLELQQLKKQLEKLHSPGFEACLANDDINSYYTGLPSKKTFNNILSIISPYLLYLYTLRKASKSSSTPSRSC